MAKVLIFSPHPDDDIIGCGGTIPKHKKISDEIGVVYLTSGGLTDDSHTREREATKAAKFLGVDSLKFLRWKDHEIDKTPKSLETIIDIIHEFSPGLIYCPTRDDQHIDHKATFDLVVRSTKLPICLYEVYPGMQQIEAEDYEDITEFIDKKTVALRMFASQKCDFAEAYYNHAKFRGIMSGIGDFCEVLKKYVRNN